MSNFLIVLSDDHRAGRGVRGMTLAWFLRTFHGRRAVRVVSPQQLSPRRTLTADYVFIGLPTSLNSQQLAGFQSREVVLFDYHDFPFPVWGSSDQNLLRSLTNRYWKPWVEECWSSDFRWGCLPIRRSRKLQACLQWQRVKSKPTKHFDYGFLGTPNGMRCVSAEGSTDSYNQRIEWLLELQRELPNAIAWGGIVIPSHLRGWAQKFPQLSSIEYTKGRVSFFRYFDTLRRCRVALTPAGNARWSYRQYEAVYARSAVISTDFSQARMLIPFPQENVQMVPDHAAVTPFVELALAQQTDANEMAEHSVGILERYLQDGVYSRRRPLLMDRFLHQFDDDYHCFRDDAA
ncbi:MAG: hypothetical protein MK179_04375 [Pirellulaceae bacterium]|nr:hypothetical protein [Pirellulaceae bacterium]